MYVCARARAERETETDREKQRERDRHTEIKCIILVVGACVRAYACMRAFICVCVCVKERERVNALSVITIHCSVHGVHCIVCWFLRHDAGAGRRGRRTAERTG